MSKKPRFFCDNCSTEVALGAKACPRCGRLFASVRCPSCNFVGGDETFAEGCPACGYSASAANVSALPAVPSAARRKKEQRPLPFWAFFLSLGIFVFFLALLLLALL